MKLNLLIFLSCLSIISYSQITISSNDVVSVGDVIYQVDDNFPNSLLNIGSAGPNQFWDFSSLNILGSYTQQCLLPTSTPYNSSYANSNLSMFDGIDYVFLNKTQSKIEILGINDSVFSQPITVLPLPMSYGTSYTEGPINFIDSSISGPTVNLLLTSFNYSASTISGQMAHFADTIKLLGKIETNFLVDAYGTIEIPMGTYDCLRLKIERNSNTDIQVHCVDTITGSGTGWYQIPFSDFDEEISYQWWTNNPDSRFFLVEAYVDSSNKITSATFTNNSMTLFEEIESLDFEVSIFSDNIISIKSKNNNLNSSFCLYDVLGKEVMKNSFKGSTSISFENFTKGSYFINLFSEKNFVKSKKVIIR